MSTGITVRRMDLAGKSWLRKEARSFGISMAELVRHLIRQKRMKNESRLKQSEVFVHYFGEKNGFEVPITRNCGFRSITFDESGID